MFRDPRARPASQELTDSLEFLDPEACRVLRDSQGLPHRGYSSWTTATRRDCSAGQVPSTAGLAREGLKACQDPEATRAPRVIKDPEVEMDNRVRLGHAGSKGSRDCPASQGPEDLQDQKAYGDQRANPEWVYQDPRVPRETCTRFHVTAISSLAACPTTCRDQRARKETEASQDHKGLQEEWAPRANLAWTASPEPKEIEETPELFIIRNWKEKPSFWRKAKRASAVVGVDGARLDLRGRCWTRAGERSRTDPGVSPDRKEIRDRRDRRDWVPSWGRTASRT